MVAIVKWIEMMGKAPETIEGVKYVGGGKEKGKALRRKYYRYPFRNTYDGYHASGMSTDAGQFVHLKMKDAGNIEHSSALLANGSRLSLHVFPQPSSRSF
ncbi:hypothetical protein PM082_016870 [Marasmius tenuissimus]|nr:hypothetical protein PM082_016870 [Marasmius tenuissimus]